MGDGGDQVGQVEGRLAGRLYPYRLVPGRVSRSGQRGDAGDDLRLACDELEEPRRLLLEWLERQTSPLLTVR